MKYEHDACQGCEKEHKSNSKRCKKCIGHYIDMWKPREPKKIIEVGNKVYELKK